MDWTPLGALIVSVILLPVTGLLWLRKADNSAVDAKLEVVNEALDAHEKEDDHLREWMADHEASDERMFREIRDGLKTVNDKLQHNFEVLIMEIRRAGNGKGN